MCNGGGNPTWPNMGGADGFNFTQNIVLLSEEPLQVGAVSGAERDDRNTHWGSNTYWSANAQNVNALQTAAVWPNGTTLAEWASSKYVDQGNPPLIADPKFKDPKERDFELLPGSPAVSRNGFIPFQLKAGCTGNPFVGDDHC